MWKYVLDGGINAPNARYRAISNGKIFTDRVQRQRITLSQEWNKISLDTFTLRGDYMPDTFPCARNSYKANDFLITRPAGEIHQQDTCVCLSLKNYLKKEIQAQAVLRIFYICIQHSYSH